MPAPPSTAELVVAISSRALFDFEEENLVFETEDDRAYMQLQLARLEQPAKPGVAYRLVKKLLGFNADGVKRVDIVILSRNDPVSGLRVFRSVKGAELGIERGVFTRGRPPYKYLNPLRATLFLSANADDVRAIRTLMDWNIEVDEAFFLGGLEKSEFLRAFEPDFFFDDQPGNIASAARHVPAGHVPHGVANE